MPLNTFEGVPLWICERRSKCKLIATSIGTHAQTPLQIALVADINIELDRSQATPIEAGSSSLGSASSISSRRSSKRLGEGLEFGELRRQRFLELAYVIRRHHGCHFGGRSLAQHLRRVGLPEDR